MLGVTTSCKESLVLRLVYLSITFLTRLARSRRCMIAPVYEEGEVTNILWEVPFHIEILDCYVSR